MVKEILKKPCTFNEAPPTRNPSISSCFESSPQLPPFTDPENFTFKSELDSQMVKYTEPKPIFHN